MQEYSIPKISTSQIEHGFKAATESPRHRFPLILHEQGAVFNRVFNFMLSDSYMQPHCHPSQEKAELIYLVDGSISVIYFDQNGSVLKTFDLESLVDHAIVVPPFTWHTYIVVSERAITYETMYGKYDPKTWKQAAPWAPSEGEVISNEYFSKLRYIISHQPKGT